MPSQDDSYEGDLQEAIKQSLKASSKNDPIVIDDSDDEPSTSKAIKNEDDPRKAMRISKQESEQEMPSKPSKQAEGSDVIGDTVTPNGVGSFQQIAVNDFLSERAQLEKERLERQKRLRSIGRIPDEQPPSKRQCNTSAEEKKDLKGKKPEVVIASTSAASPTTHASRFWTGEIRQTANCHVNTQTETRPNFRLSDILGATDELQMAFLSSFSTDISWIYSMFPPSVPVIIIQQPDESGIARVKNILPNWVMTMPFLRGGRGAMHVKLLMLIYKEHIRVCIPTGNLQPCDWREIENTVWLQDFPIRTGSTVSSSRPQKRDDFIGILTRVLTKLNVAPALIAASRDNPNLPIKLLSDLRTSFDWSKARVHLVPCMSGKYEGWSNVITSGHTRLMKAVREANARAGSQRAVTLECQGSSIGNYSTAWMNEFYHSALGESAEDWLDRPKTKRSKLPFPRIKIVFPTLKFIQESAEGELGGGTLFCRRNQWNAKGFPRELFHESRSKRGQVTMHSKMIVATFKQNSSCSKARKNGRIQNEHSSDEVVEVEPGIRDDIHGWVYIGSANFTPSAWGTLSGSSFNPTLNITNYELGILIPLTSSRMADEISCFERPPPKYASTDVPWMQEESILLAAAREE